MELALAERNSTNVSVFFFPSVRLKKRVCYQAFLTDIVETEDKNRDDFHCMQMSLVMSMRVIFGDD